MAKSVGIKRLVIGSPDKWLASFKDPKLGKPFSMKAGESREVAFGIQVPDAKAEGVVEIFQQSLSPKTQEFETEGGLTLRIAPKGQ